MQMQFTNSFWRLRGGVIIKQMVRGVNRNNDIRFERINLLYNPLHFRFAGRKITWKTPWISAGGILPVILRQILPVMGWKVAIQVNTIGILSNSLTIQ